MFLRWAAGAHQHLRIAIERGKVTIPQPHAKKISFASLGGDTFLTLALLIEESLWKYEYFNGLSIHGLDQKSPNF